MVRYLFQDRRANRGQTRIVFLMAFFRAAHFFAVRKGTIWWWLGVPVMVLYRFVSEWILGIELRANTRVGSGLRIEHGYSLVINDQTRIGANVHLRHCITIGCVKLSNGKQGPSPAIEDDVEIGANAVILGDITVGKGARIGAGSVLLTDVPPGAVAVGNPARVINRSPDGKSDPRPGFERRLRIGKQSETTEHYRR